VAVPLGRLSQADQQWVQQQAAEPASAPKPKAPAKQTYRLDVSPAKRVEALYTLELRAPQVTAREWVLYAAKLPELPGQTRVHSAMEPAGTATQELGPLRQPVLLARVPVRDATLQQAITVRVRHQATLLARHLVVSQRGPAAKPVPPLDPVARRNALAATSLLDFASPPFQVWLDRQGLRRTSDESQVDYARRVFSHIQRHYTFEYAPDIDRQASHVCTAGKSDCGGLAALFVAALRAHGIPARLLVGRWAYSARPGELLGNSPHYQQHAKAEFFAEGVGWVPADPSSAVVYDKTPDGLRYFGHDPGDFMVMHLDHDLVLDSIHFGQNTITWVQSVPYWVTGSGTLDGVEIHEDWSVRELPTD
jgi:transglutaminase-like putative cysteine protease